MSIFDITYMFPAWFLLFPGMIVLAILFRKVPVFDNVTARISQASKALWPWQVMVFRILFWALLLILTLLLAHPYTVVERDHTTMEGPDIMIVLDVSNSMQATDFDPSRIQGAKRVILEIINETRGSRIGTVLFSGQPFLFAPLTRDTNFLIEQIENISTESVPDQHLSRSGTALGDALLLAGEHLNRSETGRDSVIVLITDGEANVGIDPSVAATYLKQNNISVITVGLGDPVGQYHRFSSGPFVQETLLKLDEPTLIDIASITGGRYFRANDTLHLHDIFDEIGSLTRSQIRTERITENHPETRVLFVLFFCLSAGMFVAHVFYPRLRPF